MTKNKFGPKNHSEEVIFAVEALINEVQVAIHRLMTTKSMSKTQLAEAMGVSQARVSKILGDDAQNVTLETVAKIFHALGEAPEIRCKQLAEGSRKDSARAEAWLQSAVITRRSAANQNWRQFDEPNDRSAKSAKGGNSAAFQSVTRRKLAAAA